MITAMLRKGLSCWKRGVAAIGVLALVGALVAGHGVVLAGQRDADSPDWPQRRFDAARSGQTPMELADTLHLQWVRELPAPRRAWPEQRDDMGKTGFDISYEPVAAAGLLFVPSMVTDSVTAYDLDTGAERWRYYTDGPVRLAPAYSEGWLYFGSDDGYLYCLDAHNGELSWRFQAVPSDRTALGNERVVSMWPVRGAPVVDGGIVYFAAGIWPSEGVYVYALEAASGDVVWLNSGTGEMLLDAYGGNSYSFGTVAPQGSLAIAGDTLIVPGGRSTPAFFDLRTGDLLEFEMGKRDGGYAVSSDGLLPVRQSLIQAGSKEYDHLTWSERVDGRVWRLLAAHHRLIAVTEEGAIYCFGAEEREPIVHTWRPAALDDADARWAEEARRIMEETGADAGYAVMFGVGSGQLLEALLDQSELHLVAYDPDEAKVAALRERFSDAGLYGRRVAVHQGNALSRPLPPYIASLVVSEDIAAAGDDGAAQFAQALFHPIRPYGGAAYLFGDADARARLAATAANAELEQATVANENGAVVIARPGALPDSDSWTHQYANAANTAYSNDARVRAPLGISWFGGENNHRTLPRHMNGPVPQVSEGKLLILGVDHLTARCVYTGRAIWAKELPEVGIFFTSPAHEERFEQGEMVYFPSFYGANFRGSPYVSTSDSVYIVHEDRCLRLDLETGETLSSFALPDRAALSEQAGETPGRSYTAGIHEEDLEQRWGYVSAWDDYLIVGAYPHIFEEPPYIEGDEGHIGRPDRGRPEIQADRLWHWNAISSEYLLAMDRRSGEIHWVRQARYGFRHNAIATAAGRTFTMDNVSERVLDTMARRGIKPEFDAAIYALDVNTGEALWSYDEEVFGTWLSYSEKYDVLFQGGRAGGRSVLLDEPSAQMAALRGADGVELWRRNERHSGPAALHEANGWVIGGDNRNAVDLITGEVIEHTHPICGTSTPWRFGRTKGCGTQNTSRYLVTFRSGAGAYYDLYREGGTANLAGFRAGCTNNLIVADGMLNAPDYTRSCTCAYQHQTSLGFVHLPENEIWSHSMYRDPGPIRRVGVNFGAPGNRVADDGLVWVNYPWLQHVPSPTFDMKVEPTDAVRWFSRHSLEIPETGDSHRWVVASGGEGVTRITLSDLFTIADGAVGYTVRLHFAEKDGVEPGARVFDILIDGQEVADSFDIAEAAGDAKRGVVKSFDVTTNGSMTIELRKTNGATLEPMISGIEIAVSEAQLAQLR